MTGKIVYVKATGVKLGLLAKLGRHAGMEYERYVNEPGILFRAVGIFGCLFFLNLFRVISYFS